MGGISERIRLPLYIVRHPANRGHVLGALARAATFQARARLRGKPILATVGTAKMWVHLGNAAATKVIYGSPPDWAEMMAWQRLISPGELFIDVGANVGTYSLWVASAGARVIAVEPDGAALARLRANLALNPGIAVQVVDAALADREGTVEFTETLDTQNRIGKGHDVRSLTLDSVIGENRVRGVKVDVEGFEQVVLGGATRSLERHLVDVFQLEWNSMSLESVGADRGSVAHILIGSGYRLMRPDHEGLLHPCDPAGFGADIFALSATFERSSK